MKTHFEKLPEYCYAKHNVTGETVKIKRGESGYYPVETTLTSEDLNRVIGVTVKQAHAMFLGSMFRWDAPCADPDTHTEEEAKQMQGWKS